MIWVAYNLRKHYYQKKSFCIKVLKLWRLIMKYKIVLNETDEGYSVSCPGLPGCWSQGKTEAQAIDNIKDAIQEYLAAVYASVKDSNVREVEIAI
jgi:predicted RNase H-like HicB family nuclease